MTGRILIISGPPGAGKSTVARALTEGSGPGSLTLDCRSGGARTFFGEISIRRTQIFRTTLAQ
jgi:MoxR-like ATPase